MIAIGQLGGDVGLTVSRVVLVLLRLIMFALALGLTLISYQAYSQKQSKRLEYAFIGFAFISMGMAVSALNFQVMVGLSNTNAATTFFVFQIIETIPFIIGFALLYASLYR